MRHVRHYSDGGELRSFHVELKSQPHDRLRIAVLLAESEVRILDILAEHLVETVSTIGVERIARALRQIEAALSLARVELGLCIHDAPRFAEVVELPVRVEAVSYTDAVAAIHAALGINDLVRKTYRHGGRQ